MSRLILSICLAIAVFAPLPANVQAADPAYPEVTLPGTLVRKFHSELVDQDYRLDIGLPAGYADGEARYPVVVVLDGQWDFPLLYTINGQQYYDGVLPGLILVGLTWGGENPDVGVLRDHDFTPTDPDGEGKNGGAAKFLDFLERELIPFLDQEYRTDGRRVLVGSSYGGLFTLYAMFRRPGLFSDYLPTSPAVPWDEDALYRFADGFAERSAEHPGRLFIAVGELESLRGPVEKFAGFLTRQNYPGLAWRFQVIANAGHSGVKPEGDTRGLQYLFERPDLMLTAVQLATLAGRYRGDTDGTEVVIGAENGRLLATVVATGQNLTFLAESADRFYRRGEFLKVRFEHDSKGAATGIAVQTFEGSEHFTRIPEAP